jgi:hypothetical protein
MGLFARRRKVPVSVGSAWCVVDRFGRGWSRQQCHADLTPDTVALLAATTFMIEGAAVRAHRRLPVAPWLEATRTAAAYPDAFNETMNSGGVSPIGPAGTPGGTGMHGSLSMLASGAMTGEWDGLETFEEIALASRLFGVLVAAATWCDAEDAVERVARRLDETTAQVDYTRPSVMAQLPQAMMGYGLQQPGRDRLSSPRRHEDGPGR